MALTNSDTIAEHPEQSTACIKKQLKNINIELASNSSFTCLQYSWAFSSDKIARNVISRTNSRDKCFDMKFSDDQEGSYTSISLYVDLIQRLVGESDCRSGLEMHPSLSFVEATG